MKILVTGATGFIGNHLIKELLETDHEVIATGIETKNELVSSWKGKVKYIQYDMNKEHKDTFILFQEPHLLIHLFWEGLPNYTDLFHFEKNLFNSYFFIKDLILGGLKDVAVIGTCLEYGMKNGKLSESMKSAPENSYAIGKDTLRKFLEQLQLKYSFSMKWIRLFYMYGEGQSKNSLLEQLKRTVVEGETTFNMSAGEQLRDYLPVETVAEYISKIALQKKICGIINCCRGTPISIRNFVENYISENNISIELNLGYYPYPKYEPMAFWGDNSKLKKILGDENNESN